MTTPPARIQVTQYVVSCIPEASIDHLPWSVTVEYRGHGRWAVLHGRKCLGLDGTWDYDTRDMDDDWLEYHRFSEQVALSRAQEWASKVRVNGLTVADVLARGASRG